jgi:hypothetical protein
MRKLVVSVGFAAFALATGSFAALGCSDNPQFIAPGDEDPAAGGSSTANPENASATSGADGGGADSARPPLPQFSLLLDGSCTGGDCEALVDCTAPQGGSALVGTKCFSSDGQCKGPANGDSPRNVYGCYDTGIAIWTVDSKCGANAKDPSNGGACQETTGIAACEEGVNNVAGTTCAAPGARCTVNQVIYSCSPGNATSSTLSQLCADATAGSCAGLGACPAPAPGGSACTVEGKTCVVKDDLPTAGATSTAGKAYTCIRR